MTNTTNIKSTTNDTQCTTVALSGARRRRRRWFTVLLTMAAAVLLWTLAVPLGGVDLQVRAGDDVRDVGQLAVVLTSLLAGLAGWASLGFLERRTGRATVIWRVVALVVYALSLLAGPTAAVTLAAGLVLAGLHTVVAGLLVWLLPRAGASR